MSHLERLVAALTERVLAEYLTDLRCCAADPEPVVLCCLYENINEVINYMDFFWNFFLSSQMNEMKYNYYSALECSKNMHLQKKTTIGPQTIKGNNYANLLVSM